MQIEAVDVDSERIALDVLPRLEQAFGIRFTRDLTHVRTAGDLFDEVRQLRAASGVGAVDTSMAFHALRRALAPYWREEASTPATPLRGQELPLPHKLRKILQQRTGYELPKPRLSMFGCLVALALGGLGVYLLAIGEALGGVAALGVCIAALALDPGEFSGEWQTLGSLTRAAMEYNFADQLDRARDAEEEEWRTFAAALAGHAFVGDVSVAPDDIGRDTRLRFAQPVG